MATPQASKLMDAFQKVLVNIPNFTTDETAQIPNKQGSISRTYKYLNLATILKTAKDVFAKAGIGFYQNVRFEYGSDNKGMQVGTVDTIIFGYGEERKLGEYPFVVTGDPQANGSAVTYARRYALYAVLGVYPDKDDDGAAARDYYNKTPATPAEPTISPEQAQELTKLSKQHNVNPLISISQHRGSKVNRLSEITVSEYTEYTNWLKNGAQ